MKKIVSKEEEEIWKERYLKGETARAIAKDYPWYNESTISKHIQKMGISRGKGIVSSHQNIKPIILKEYQEDLYSSCLSLSRKYNISDRTISKWLKKENIPIKQKQGFLSKANQDYFEKINTPNKAYLLGFITADGAVVAKRKGEKPLTCSIEVQEKDKGIIYFAQKEINPLAKITDCNYGKKHNIKISFNGFQLCSHLEKYGIVQNKSKIIKEVPISLIPKELLCYYFRGLIDGDGCIHKDGKISIYSGSYDFICSVQRILCEELGLRKLKIYHGTTWFITWSRREDKEKLFKYLYENKLNNTYYYQRKYERLFKSLYANTEVNNSIAKGELSPQSVGSE